MGISSEGCKKYEEDTDKMVSVKKNRGCEREQEEWNHRWIDVLKGEWTRQVV
jgi:hypothetical protein